VKASERQKDHARLLANLKLIQKNYSVSELSELLGISNPTWIAKMKEPWRKFSYDEFYLIAQYCRIDLMQLISGELKIR
jgi:hypothetical protein